MATQVLRRDSQVEMAGPEDKKLPALDQERLAAHAIYKFTSALGTPVRVQPAFPGSPPELVGAIVAVNKYRALGNTSELVHDKDGFSEVDKALFVGIAQQLGMALKLATRQAIMQTAQEDHVESIVSATSVIAGVLTLLCSLWLWSHACGLSTWPGLVFAIIERTGITGASVPAISAVGASASHPRRGSYHAARVGCCAWGRPDWVDACVSTTGDLVPPNELRPGANLESCCRFAVGASSVPHGSDVGCGGGARGMDGQLSRCEAVCTVRGTQRIRG